VIKRDKSNLTSLGHDCGGWVATVNVKGNINVNGLWLTSVFYTLSYHVRCNYDDVTEDVRNVWNICNDGLFGKITFNCNDCDCDDCDGHISDESNSKNDCKKVVYGSTKKGKDGTNDSDEVISGINILGGVITKYGVSSLKESRYSYYSKISHVARDECLNELIRLIKINCGVVTYSRIAAWNTGYSDLKKREQTRWQWRMQSYLKLHTCLQHKNGGENVIDEIKPNCKEVTYSCTAIWKYRILMSQNQGCISEHCLLFFICDEPTKHEWTALNSLSLPQLPPLKTPTPTLTPTPMMVVLWVEERTTMTLNNLTKTLKNSINLRRQLVALIHFLFYFLHLSCKVDNKNTKAQIESNFDSIDGNKGSVLYAPPELLAEHYVFLLNNCNKGGTISYTRSKNILILLISVNRLQIYSCLYKGTCELWLETRVAHLFRTDKARHRSAIATLVLIHDIESNPGPVPVALRKSNITVVSLNCRGLGNMDKARLLLNKIYALPQNQPLIVMLQETMIVSGKYLELAWRGKFIQTAGTGNSQGCITLVGADCDLTEIQHYGNRGHFFKLRLGTGEILKVCNIYAPNGFDANKTDFFNMVLQDTANWDGPLIIGGDFNTTLGPSERHNRSVTVAETRVADMLKDYALNQNLNDCWDGNTGYTWRKGKSMSRLDRIYTRTPDYVAKKLSTHWTLTTSDHAGLILTLEHKQRTYHRNEHVKLDNGVVQNKETLNELMSYVNEQLLTATDMNPHVKLEFTKMTIRTKALEIMARNKRKESERLNEINSSIKENMRLLTLYTDQHSHRILTGELEELGLEKDEILRKQGMALAHRARTKWYNEGERSNKYFLNLLKRHSESSEMKTLIVDDNEITNPDEIRDTVTQFYHKLYNKDDALLAADDRFLEGMFQVREADDGVIGEPVTINELWLTLKPTKATTPGPDGLSNTYLKKLWGIIGPIILEAWEYSIRINTLPPSHKTSLLRLIPKAGKDSKLLKNWRPITLSNCDHKLITRLYNNRLLKTVGDKISQVQTAYIKGRSISDNLRLLNAAVNVVDYEEDINATIIALDAQKAFDSVSHSYILQVLRKAGLTKMIPIFQLLYKDLKNDIIINGSIGRGYTIKNGVKQGDALSCSLFILAMEPLIRNITNNDRIGAVRSNRLNFTWPKVVAYADDITVLTNNEQGSVSAIFEEYNKLTCASGLTLNAEKTEKFNIHSRNITRPETRQVVRYGEQEYRLVNQDSIKLNGIIFRRDRQERRQVNFENMLNKMKAHFTEWGRRSLSLLGKVQIIKTFGISQYLYALAVIDIGTEHWKILDKEIHKFIWNKHYSTQANAAPHRVKLDITYTDLKHGGFGMVKLERIMKAARVRRFAYLMAMKGHPVADLQASLGADKHLRKRAKLDIDDVTSGALNTLHEHHLQGYAAVNNDDVSRDLLMHRLILGCGLKDVTAEGRTNSIEITMLRQRGVCTVSDAVRHGRDSMQILRRVACPQLKRPLAHLQRHYCGRELPDIESGIHIFNSVAKQWHKPGQLTSRQIRTLLWESKCIVNTKLLQMTEENAIGLFHKLSRLKNIQNKSKMFRLIHGDVYCGARLYRFGLADTDRCIRCFEEETTQHLLYECPYSREVWGRLGMLPSSATEIINGQMSRIELEIRAEILSNLVFRKKVLAPDILIKMVLKSFEKGLSRSKGVTEHAKMAVSRHELTGQWFT
jgi:hypothetical protein